MGTVGRGRAVAAALVLFTQLTSGGILSVAKLEVLFCRYRGGGSILLPRGSAVAAFRSGRQAALGGFVELVICLPDNRGSGAG